VKAHPAEAVIYGCL